MIFGAAVRHFFDGWLVVQEVAAVDGVVQVFPLVVAVLASKVVDAVNAALRAGAV